MASKLTQRCDAYHSSFDVIIVGAGVIGSSTGYYLTFNTDKNVLLIEQVQIVQSQSVHVISSLIGFTLEVVLMEHHVSQGKLTVNNIT